MPKIARPPRNIPQPTKKPDPKDDIREVPIADLVLDPRNARKGQLAPIVDSLREFGQHRPAVVQRSTNRVLVGNHMVRAATSLGWKTIRVWFVDDDDKKAIRRAIADNATGDQAQWDEIQLLELLNEVGRDVPGVDAAMIDELLSATQKEELAKINEGAVFPIVPRFNEKYSYAVVIATNETEDAWLRTHFDLRKEQSYKGKSIVHSRIVTAERYRDLLEGKIVREDKKRGKKKEK